MFDYAKFAEGWAELYKPMHHIPGPDSLNKRFFICDSYTVMTDFMRTNTPEDSPCVIIESQQEGNISDGRDYPRYSYYFMVRAGEMNDGHEAIKAKADAKYIMMEFINFLRVFKEYDEREEQLRSLDLRPGSYLDQLRTSLLEMNDRTMENLNLDDYVYESLNQVYDGWYGIQFTLDDQQLINKCIDLSLYNI